MRKCCVSQAAAVGGSKLGYRLPPPPLGGVLKETRRRRTRFENEGRRDANFELLFMVKYLRFSFARFNNMFGYNNKNIDT